jgi:predicted DNA-binding transcriptional regulator AlpA
MEQVLRAVEKLVKARVVAATLGMAQSQVYRLARSGTIPSFQ